MSFANMIRYVCHLQTTQCQVIRRQCTYNVTLRRISATIVAVEKQRVYTTCVYICSLRYLARSAHAPSVVCPAPKNFFTFSQKGRVFGGGGGY